MAFTAGGLLLPESVKIAEFYVELGDWKKVRDTAIEKNVLQSRTQSSAQRLTREAVGRLKELPAEEMELLLEGTSTEQRHVLWLAACKHYRFIFDFAVEVIREKVLLLDHTLERDDYDKFFNSKADWHDELERLTDSTKQKLREVVFKMLREAGFWENGIILPPILTPRFVQTVSRRSSEYLAALPVPGSEIAALLG